MPRLSCVFCVFAPFSALVIAGQNNPELLQKYVDVEERIGHSFNKDFSLKDVQTHIAEKKAVLDTCDWLM